MNNVNLIIGVALIVLVGGCQQSKNGTSIVAGELEAATPVNTVEASAELSGLKEQIAVGEALEQKIASQRSEFQAQTAAKVGEEEAHLMANMDNYSATASGVEARMLQENFIKKVKIAGLQAEKNLIEQFLPVKKEMALSLAVIAKQGADVSEIRNHRIALSSKNKKFSQYLKQHASVRFPVQE